jgi:uncharacterized protein (UPF0297 family)
MVNESGPQDGADEPGETRALGRRPPERSELAFADVLLRVYRALQEKGYDPLRQIAHYLLSGEPAYITAHLNARSLVARLERDEVIEELLRVYLSRIGA